MAFGIKREELKQWKQQVLRGNIAFLTHYWIHPKYPELTTVTKVGCADLEKLYEWGRQYNLKPEWIHNREEFPHFDLIGHVQYEILRKEGLLSHIDRFSINDTKRT